MACVKSSFREAAVIRISLNRILLDLGMAILLMGSVCVAQDSNPSAAPSAVKQPATGSASAGQISSPAPVEPQTAVPDERNGQDPYGRPVQPVGVAEARAPSPVAPSEQYEFVQNVKDVYFDFNRSELRTQDQATLQRDAEWLKAHPNVLLTIAGEADPRGDIVYNLCLSDQRALATRDALIEMGVPRQQVLFAEGWGKLYPVCQQDHESCWSQDRRAHFEPWSPDAGPAHLGTASGVE